MSTLKISTGLHMGKPYITSLFFADGHSDERSLMISYQSSIPLGEYTAAWDHMKQKVANALQKMYLEPTIPIGPTPQYSSRSFVSKVWYINLIPVAGATVRIGDF